MKPITIEPARQLRGEIDLPGDKSISHRALMLGSLSKGRTVARNILDCDDCDRTAGAFAGMGVAIRKDGDLTVIDGAGLRGLKKPQKPIQVGESGTTMRILAGILAGQGFETSPPRAAPSGWTRSATSPSSSRIDPV